MVGFVMIVVSLQEWHVNGHASLMKPTLHSILLMYSHHLSVSLQSKKERKRDGKCTMSVKCFDRKLKIQFQFGLFHYRRFCFDTYDLNDDGYISREEMLLLLKDCMYKNSRETNEEDGDDGVKDLIEMTMRKMDQDRDGRVSYSDFMETVQEVRTENESDEIMENVL